MTIRQALHILLHCTISLLFFSGNFLCFPPSLSAAMISRSYFYATIDLLFLCFIFNCFSCLAADTISANQALSWDQTIVSSYGHFELGFFSPGNSSKFYIGIWYSTVSIRTIVWVANRETPILDKDSARFAISDGNLVLFNESRSAVWSTGVNSTASNRSSVVAVLLDSGNLVLTDGSGSNSSIDHALWQSFDFPADTWLPGGKISYDKRTRTRKILTSWKNSEDPAPGLFSLELDPNGSQYIILWNRTVEYWTSGAWDGHIFSRVPEMRLNYIYNFSYIDNENETYFTYSLYDPSFISRFIMDVSGQIKQLSWIDDSNWNPFWSQPRQQCDVNAYCGAFGICNQNSLPFCNCLPGFRHRSENDWNLLDYSSGCVREVNSQCNGSIPNRERDRFFPSPYVNLPDNHHSFSVVSVSECESSCLNNCSCMAYSYDGNVCSIWDGDLFNLQQLSEGDGNGRTIYVRLSSSSPLFRNSRNSKLPITIGAVFGSAAFIAALLTVVAAVVCRKWKREAGSCKLVEGTLVAFRYKDLVNATKDFSEKLGGGGFGSVFKGTLPDKSVFAVKKLESISQGEKQFRMEVSTIGTIQHVNLVRLRGFCSEGSKKLLVYDYMENGSLDSHLLSKGPKFLDWKTRYGISLGVARGLAYLHEKCRDCIIHCDIKPENILLDSGLCPKVADFGLAKLVGRDFSRVLTTMRGTRGYLAPEWISGLAITPKADVYSYGMVLFELVSGRRNSEESRRFFPAVAARVAVEGGDLVGLVDPALGGDFDPDEAMKVCRVACWCVQDDERLRPSMGQVVRILEGVVEVDLPVIPGSLAVFAEESREQIVFFTDSSSRSSGTRSVASIGSAVSKVAPSRAG